MVGLTWKLAGVIVILCFLAAPSYQSKPPALESTSEYPSEADTSQTTPDDIDDFFVASEMQSAYVGKAFYFEVNSIFLGAASNYHNLFRYHVDFGDGTVVEWTNESSIKHVYKHRGYAEITIKVRDTRDGKISVPRIFDVKVEPRPETADPMCWNAFIIIFISLLAYFIAAYIYDK